MLVLTLAGGCADTARREFARELDPVVGRVDKNYFIEKYGEPENRIAVDSNTDVWEYTFGRQSLSDYGARTNMETQTLLRLTFKNGTLSSWRATARVR